MQQDNDPYAQQQICKRNRTARVQTQPSYNAVLRKKPQWTEAKTSGSFSDTETDTHTENYLLLMITVVLQDVQSWGVLHFSARVLWMFFFPHDCKCLHFLLGIWQYVQCTLLMHVLFIVPPTYLEGTHVSLKNTKHTLLFFSFNLLTFPEFWWQCADRWTAFSLGQFW